MRNAGGRDYFLRRYRNYQDSSRLNIITIKYRGRIIGFSGFIPFRAHFLNKEVKGLITPDVFIEPSARRRFPILFSRLYLFQRKILPPGTGILLTFPHDEKIFRGFSSLGWRRFSKLYSFRFPLRLFSSFPRVGYGAVEVGIKKSFTKDVRAFYQRIRTQYDFLILADERYLNFRYARWKSRSYTIFTAYQKNKMLGYLISRQDGPRGYIVELVADLQHPKVILLLLCRAIESFKENTVRVFCSLSHRKYITVLRDFGFLPFRKKDCLFLSFSSSIPIFNSSLCHINRTGRDDWY